MAFKILSILGYLAYWGFYFYLQQQGRMTVDLNIIFLLIFFLIRHEEAQSEIKSKIRVLEIKVDALKQQLNWRL